MTARGASNPYVVIPAKAGVFTDERLVIQRLCLSANAQRRNESHWIPAFAGMTSKSENAA